MKLFLTCLWLIPVFTLLCVSCTRCSLPGGGNGAGSTVTLMSWNVQNLFDDVDNGSEYREFDPGDGDWTTEKFHEKMLDCAEVIEAAVPGGPDILVLQEVENRHTLETLNTEVLKGLGYTTCIMVESPGSAVNTALLSRFHAEDIRSHRVHGEGSGGVRAVTEVELKVGGESLFILNNHWKSKLGGAPETEPLRIAAAALCVRRIREISGEAPGAALLVCGDLNENHDEYFRTGGGYMTALMPVNAAAGDDEENVLWLTPRPDECRITDKRVVLYSPWFEEEFQGSYLYRNIWETIDHTLCSGSLFDGTGIEFRDFSVVAGEFMVNESGAPLKWSPELLTGYSDHLPLLVTLILAE